MSGTVTKASLYAVVRVPVAVSKASLYVPLAVPLNLSKFSLYTVIGATVTRISAPLEVNYKIQVALDLDTDYRVFHDVVAELETDYKVLAVFNKDLPTDYKLTLYHDFTTSYIINDQPPLTGIYKDLTISYKFTVDKQLTISYVLHGLPIDIDLATSYAVEGLGKSLSIDYGIALYKDVTTSYKIALVKDLDTDYEIEGEWRKDLVTSYKISLVKELTSTYHILFGQPLSIDYRIGYVSAIEALYIARLPEVPVIETWQFVTKITTSRNGKEQRMAMRRRPRIGLSHTYIIENAADFRHFQNSLLQQRSEDVLVCQHSQAVSVQEASYGSTTVYCPMENTDIRVGEYVAFFNIGTEESALRVVDTIASDHFTTESGMPFDIGRGCVVMPVRLMRFADGAGLRMKYVSGETELSFSDATSRVLTRAGYFAGLTEFDGYTILTQRPLADSDIQTAYSAGFVTIDLSERLPPNVVRHWPAPVASRSHEWLIQRGEAFDYWREFADTIRGSWKAFLMPTFRPDLVAITFAGASLTIAGNKLDDMFAHGGYKRLMITTDAGTDYFSVSSAIVNGDNTDLTLSDSLSGTVVKEISFINLVRISDDVLSFEHAELQSKLTLNMRIVQQ